MLNGSNDADSHKSVPSYGFIDTVSYLEGQIAPKPQFLGA